MAHPQHAIILALYKCNSNELWLFKVAHSSAELGRAGRTGLRCTSSASLRFHKYRKYRKYHKYHKYHKCLINNSHEWNISFTSRKHRRLVGSLPQRMTSPYSWKMCVRFPLESFYSWVVLTEYWSVEPTALFLLFLSLNASNSESPAGSLASLS